MGAACPRVVVANEFPNEKGPGMNLAMQNPMRALNHLFANNRVWADRIQIEDPQFFRKLSH